MVVYSIHSVALLLLLLAFVCLFHCHDCSTIIHGSTFTSNYGGFVSYDSSSSQQHWNNSPTLCQIMISTYSNQKWDTRKIKNLNENQIIYFFKPSKYCYYVKEDIP